MLYKCQAITQIQIFNLLIQNLLEFINLLGIKENRPVL